MNRKQNLTLGIGILLATVLLWHTNQLTATMQTGGTFTDTGQSLGNAITYDLAAGYLDNNGSLDVFEASNTGIRAWLNDGSATFASTQSFNTTPATGLALGDLDGNSTSDAAVGHGNGVSIWLNDGTANFSDTGQLLGSSTSLLQAVALGDLDGDTDLDLFTASTQPNTVWLNNGTAVFTDTGQSLGSQASNSVTLGDVDGDSDLDAVVANGWQFATNQASKLYLNNGSGLFTEAQDLAVGWHYDAALGDLDGDADLDIVFSSWQGAGQVWLNQGGTQGGILGQFLAGGSVGGANGWRLALADVEPDGDLDVMQAVNNNQGARLWLNDGSGSFIQDSQALSPFSQAVVLADFDTDTDPDVMFGRSVNNKVWLNGESVPNTPTPTSTPTNTPGPTATPPTPIPAGAKAWRRDIAASTGGAGFNLALALDSKGQPHFSHYERDSRTLNYVQWDGVRWHREIVTHLDSFAHRASFLAVDQTDRPHLLYQTSSLQWQYRWRQNGEWQLVASLSTPHTADAILDSNNQLAVAHTSNRSLAVTRWLGSDWDSKVVDNRFLETVEAALAAGSGNELHLAYSVSPAGGEKELIYGHFDGSSWITETVLTAPFGGSAFKEVDLALNDLNQPVILYRITDGDDNVRLRRVIRSGATWSQEELFSNSSEMTTPSLVYDNLGQAHLLFALNNRPYYGSESGGWQFQALPGDESVLALTDLALDDFGDPHFGFRDAGYLNLNYQFFGPAWKIHPLEVSDSARLPAIAHLNSQVAVSFYSLVNEKLRFFRREPDAWQDRPIANLALPIVNSSIRLALDGQHVASYRDSVNDRLMFGRFNGVTWQTEIVDDSGDVGYDNTLFVLSTGPLIVYWDADNHRVKIAQNNGSGWTLFANDAGSGQNADSGFPRAVLQRNTVYITYYDGVQQALRLATFNLSTQNWADILLAGGVSTVSPFHDITQVRGSQLLVAYHDQTADQIKLATGQVDAGVWWSFDPVANGIPAIRGLELEAVSYAARRSLRLVYLDDTTDSVVMASQRNGDWTFETVRDGDNFLAEPALALGEHPYLAYAAIGNDILQLAVRVPDELQRGIIYNPYNPGDNGDNGNYIGDICVDIIDDESEQAIGGLDSWQPPVITTDYDIFAAMTDLFLRTPDGRRYTDLYLQHLEEVMALGAADPLLLWDSYHTLQDFIPGLEALVTGKGDSVVVTQRMVDNALAVWQRLAVAGSPALAQTINDGLADHNNLQDFVGMTFDEWALAIGVEPPGEKSIYLPVIIR